MHNEETLLIPPPSESALQHPLSFVSNLLYSVSVIIIHFMVLVLLSDQCNCRASVLFISSSLSGSLSLTIATVLCTVQDAETPRGKGCGIAEREVDAATGVMNGTGRVRGSRGHRENASKRHRADAEPNDEREDEGEDGCELLPGWDAHSRKMRASRMQRGESSSAPTPWRPWMQPGRREAGR